MKKVILFLIILSVNVTIVFARGESEGARNTVGLSLSTLNNPFFVTLKQGAKQKAKERGLDLIVLDAQDNPSKQLNDIEDLLRKKVSVILINPTDSDAVVSAIKLANKAGIPVITVDRSANGGTIASHVASDNVAGGMRAGEYLLKQVGRGARVIELEGVPGASATRDRGAGFHKVVDTKLDVVARQTANFNRAEGLSVMENLLQTHKNITGVFAHNDEMALGAVKALEAAGMNSVLVVGFDATDDAVAAVKSGAMKATVAQKPALIGSLSVESAYKLMNKQAVDAVVNVELELITK